MMHEAAQNAASSFIGCRCVESKVFFDRKGLAVTVWNCYVVNEGVCCKCLIEAIVDD